MNGPGREGRRVVVTGMGLVTPIGNDRTVVSESLRSGRHGLERVCFLENPDLPVKVAGTIKEFAVDSTSWREWSWPERYTVPRETLRGLAPHGVYAFCAVSQALEDARLRTTDVARDDATGLFCASAGSAMLLHHNLSQMDAARGERGNPLGVVSSIAGTLNFNLAAHFQITGAVCGFVSACASSSHALGYAYDAIRLGRLGRAIVVGAEELNAETILPFAAMRALTASDDPAGASRPFDVSRDGFVGAGGAVALVLEEASGAVGRGVAPLGEVIGWGEAADGHSIAVSHPAGIGLATAMRRALADARVEPGEVDVVNAHATSTPVGDRAEARALHAVFDGAQATPAIQGTKGLTGHPLSMSGIMEAAFCIIQMNEGFLCGTAGLTKPDDACAGLHILRETRDRAAAVFLNNSSGFGGSNVCHLLKRWSG